MLWSLTKLGTDNAKPNAYNSTLLSAHNKVPQIPIKYVEVDIGAILHITVGSKIITLKSLQSWPAWYYTILWILK